MGHKIRDWLFLAVPGLFGAAVYLEMIPAQFSAANFGEDGGDLLAAAMTAGVPHPTGYPTYILLLRLFLGLPGGSSYWKGALLSAVAAGLALVFLAFYVAYLGNFTVRSKVAAIISGLALGFAPLFWSQAVIVEVQALQALFVCLLLWWIVLMEIYRANKRIHYLLILLAGCAGLSLGNHLTIFFLFPLVLAAEIKAVQKGMQLRWIACQGLAFLVGCLVLVYLPLAARNFPPVNWGNPQSLAGLAWLLSGSPYQNMLFGVSQAQFLERLGNLAKLLWDQFNIGILAAAVGLLLSRSFSRTQRWGFFWIFFVNCIFYLTYNSRDSIVYLIPAWIVFSIWIGEGAGYFFMKIDSPSLSKQIILGLLMVGLFARIPLAWNSVNPSRDTVTAGYLAQILQTAPADALILTTSDYDTFPLWVGTFGEGQRSDLRVVSYPLTQFGWYQDTLRHGYPDLNFPAEQLDLGWGDALVRMNANHPVCRSETLENIPQRIRITCGDTFLLEVDFSNNGN